MFTILAMCFCAMDLAIESSRFCSKHWKLLVLHSVQSGRHWVQSGGPLLHFGGKQARSKWPATLSKQRENHWRETGNFSSGASELLDIIPPVRYILEAQPLEVREQVAKELKSFCCFADVISLWCLGKAGIDVGDEFADAIEQHGVAFQAAYKDREAYIPKFHFAKHLPRQGDFTSIHWYAKDITPALKTLQTQLRTQVRSREVY